MLSSRGIGQFAVCLGILLAFCFSVGAASSFAAGSGYFDVYAALDAFTWKEFSGHDRLLKENGALGGVGFAYHGLIGEGGVALTLTPRIEIFTGEVDYDGQACDTAGNCFPSITDTGYLGTKLEFDLGGRFGKGFVIEPFGGLGIRSWLRDIQDTVAYNPFSGSAVAVSGYTEDWTAIYLRLGLRGDIEFSQASNMFFEAVAKVPVYNENVAYLSDVAFYYEDVTLKPGKQVSFFAELGFRRNAFKISGFYESLRFPESDHVIEYNPFFGAFIESWQPESDADIFGVRIGASF